MQATSEKLRNCVFYVLVTLFALLLALFSPTGRMFGVQFVVLAILGIAFGALGLVLVILTARLHEPGIRKAFFMLSGASAAAIPICALLHNMAYGLFIVWFGEGFWEAHGKDEPLFFLLAIVVCPVVFLIGAVGSSVLLLNGKGKSVLHK